MKLEELEVQFNPTQKGDILLGKDSIFIFLQNEIKSFSNCTTVRNPYILIDNRNGITITIKQVVLCNRNTEFYRKAKEKS